MSVLLKTTAMKIAYLINTYPSPSHSFVRREIAALEAGGITVERFAVRRPDTATKAEDRADAQRTRYVLDAGMMGLLMAFITAAIAAPARMLKAIRLTIKVGRRSDIGVLKHAIYLLEACQLKRWLSDAQVNHLHAHFGTNSTTVAMLCRELGGPAYSFTAHGPEEFDKPLSLCLDEKIARSAFVVAVCSYGRSQLYRWCNRSQWSKVHVVHCGVDERFLRAEPETIGTAPTLLQVGRLCEQKGQALLIEAARIVRDQNVEFKLTLVGDGELRNELQTLIGRYSLENHVTLAGWKSEEEIRQLMLASRTIVMPSFAEGLPVVIMEALALSRPVISTFVAGIPELIQNRTCGWLVPAGDASSLAEAMVMALAMPSESLDRMGAFGRKRVLERHDAQIEAGRLASLFRRSVAMEGSKSDEATWTELVPSSSTPSEG